MSASLCGGIRALTYHIKRCRLSSPVWTKHCEDGVLGYSKTDVVDHRFLVELFGNVDHT